MNATVGLRGLPRLLVAALLVAAALVPSVAATARAADIAFGTPGADAQFADGITFTVPLTASVPPERVEIRLRYPGSLGPFIEDVPAGASSSETLEYRLDLTGGAHLVPNTTIQATWAAFPAGGGEPVLSEAVTVRYEDTSKEWRTLEGDLVRVHWYDGSEAFARRALAIGDAAVKETAGLLGVTESEPIDFFIYGDEAAFRTALGPGTRENVGGQAHAEIRTLFALIEPGSIDDTWVRVVIPHELTHLVFDTAVDNPYRFPPRWVNEGLAVYLSEGYTPGDRNYVADAVDRRELLPLTALTGQFPTDPEKTYLAYAEAVSAIDHLVRVGRRARAVRAHRCLRDRPDRRRGVHQGAGPRRRGVPGRLAGRAGRGGAGAARAGRQSTRTDPAGLGRPGLRGQSGPDARDRQSRPWRLG